MKYSKISVIICTKNRFADFKATIESLIKQTRLPDELIVADSSDTKVISEYLNSSDIPIQFRYFHTTPGLTHQRNVGIEKSSGDILFFFDDDVDLEVNYIELIEKVFLSDTSLTIGAAGGRISNSEQVGSKSILSWLKRKYFSTLRYIFLQSKLGDGKFRYSGMPSYPYLRKISGYIECLSGCSMAFRRQIFNQAQFDEELPNYSLMEDADISKQVLNAGYKIYYEASAVLEVKVSPHSRLSERELAEVRVLHYTYYFRKHWPQTLWRKAVLYWTLLGLFILYLHSSLGRQGVLSAIKKISRADQKKELNSKNARIDTAK